ncbi:MAG: M13 family metallopeptidase [Niveispirillum sp.]|uniref:M13 family metallopeptidase n=1 Tax=Niveispirillum sp. TaxID=1917217 RepID=UPI003BA5B5B7
MMKRIGLGASSLLALGLTFVLSGTALADTDVQVAQMAPAAAKAGKPPAPGLPVLDDTVSPCDNFFLHACGVWKRENPIPDDQARWGNFNVLGDKNLTLLRQILDEAVAKPDAKTARIADFYAACMDEAGVDAKGLAPLSPMLNRINGLTDRKDLGAVIGYLHDQGVNALFGFGRMQKFSDAVQTIAAAGQGGLGLPDRDFYFKDDARSKEQRAAYVAHVARMFELAGTAPDAAKAKADAVMAFETALAEASMTRLERRDPQKQNNPTVLADFAKSVPAIDWNAYLAAIGAPAFTEMNVGQPKFFEALNAKLSQASLDDIKTYLTWHTLRANAQWLPMAFSEEAFNFYGRTLNGTKEQRPRWKRCVAATDNALGEDLGKYFVEKAFGPEHKKRMLTMVGDVQAALKDRISNLDWMSPETKAKAHEKLANMPNKIGYPDNWRDYSTLTISKGDLLGNVARSEAFEQRRQLSRIGQPRDSSEWGMTPPTVNAYYSPQQNNINFPAGILQPPFFDFTADDAYNYGAIGGVIGHEIIHGFDDQGRKFSGDGNLADWWTADDAKRFTERAQCLVDQYSGFQAVEGVNLNGKQTLGENTADNGGLPVALDALKRRLGEAGMKKKIGGLSAEQRFFYGWANVWCAQERPEFRRLQAQTGVHSLPEYRVNGTLSNMPEFAKAFSCKPTDAMVRGDKACKVW